jgi:uncharacterized protein with HEPN domain
MPHSARKLLLDISLACQEIIEFTEGKSYEDFQEDRLLQLAIEREFEIIGEALFRLEKVDPETLTNKIPEYRKIIDFRNILAHGYDIIDVAAMWDFVQNRVPELLKKVQDY